MNYGANSERRISASLTTPRDRGLTLEAHKSFLTPPSGGWVAQHVFELSFSFRFVGLQYSDLRSLERFRGLIFGCSSSSSASFPVPVEENL